MFKKKENKNEDFTKKEKIIIYSIFFIVLGVIGLVAYNLFGNLNNDLNSSNSPKVKRNNGVIINGEEKAYADDEE